MEKIIMKKVALLVFVFFMVTLINAQEFKYIRAGETFYDSKGRPLFAKRFVKINSQPKTVPEGKIWMTVENKYLFVEFDDAIHDSKTACSKKFREMPKVIFGIKATQPYDEEKNYGIIFSRCDKEDYGVNRYRFVPDAFVRDDFDFSLLKQFEPRMLGRFDIKFYPGTQVYVDKCIRGMEVVEIDASSSDLWEYNRIRAQKKREYDQRMAELERIRIAKKEAALKAKINKGHIFSLNELDIKPEYKLHTANFLELYKLIYYNKFYIDFILNEDETIKVIDSKEVKINDRLIRDFMKFTPGMVEIGGDKLKVKTKIRIIFSYDEIKELKASEANFRVKKRNKEPSIVLKDIPPNYSERALKRLIGFEKMLKRKDTGNYEFHLERFISKVVVVFEDTNDEIISQKVEKYRIKYRSGNGGWVF